MKLRDIIKSSLVCWVLISVVNVGFAENIDPDNDDSQYAYGENVGWLNFEPNIPDPNVGATVSDHNLTGFIWAENIGWINLSPSTYGGVINDGYGNLAGYAWSENVGWINFDPNVPNDSNDYGVTIDADGNFDGYAWGENIGWINFNSADLFGYNVKACKVNFRIFARFAQHWLEVPCDLANDWCDGADLDYLGDVDSLDLGLFADGWLDYCPGDWLL